jgi:hypothetical protein
MCLPKERIIYPWKVSFSLKIIMVESLFCPLHMSTSALILSSTLLENFQYLEVLSVLRIALKYFLATDLASEKWRVFLISRHNLGRMFKRKINKMSGTLTKEHYNREARVSGNRMNGYCRTDGGRC